jgi:hypothetical protein
MIGANDKKESSTKNHQIEACDVDEIITKLTSARS